MDNKTIYSKTGKGVLEIKNKAGKLAKDLAKVLTLVDGKSTVEDLKSRSKFDDAEINKALSDLTSGGYIKEFTNTSGVVGSGVGGGASGGYVDDLDFTSSLAPGKNVYQNAQSEWRQRETADRTKAEQDANRAREEKERQKKDQAAKQAREDSARLTKVESERKAKEAAAQKLREESERKAKGQAEVMAQTQRDLAKILEAERKAMEETERKKVEEQQAKVKEEVEQRARAEQERKLKEEQDRKREAEEAKRREEEERKRQEEEARKKVEDDRKRKEDEERNRKEEEARKKREDEERKKREEEERKKREEEERKRKEEEERKRREEEERKRREEEERKKREEKERKKREEEERKRKEEEERKRKEEEERKKREEEERIRAEQERLRKEEQERLRREEEERKRREEEERVRAEEERLRKEEEERLRREEEERLVRRAEENRRRREEDERREREDQEARARSGPTADDRAREEEETRRAEEDKLRREEDERREREADDRRREEEGRREREAENSRREEESRREREAEDRRREEDERRERDATERRRNEEEARRKQDEQNQRKRDEDERRRREEEERAQATAKSTMPDLDMSGLFAVESQVNEEFDKQQEALRKREEEEERQRDEEDRGRQEVERAEREEQARQESERREAEDAERRERMERERVDREGRERKRQEEKEARIREQEEAKIKREHERQRQEEMKVENERRSREEGLVKRRKDQEDRDRKRAEVDSLKKHKGIKSPLERLKPVIIGVVVLVAIVLGGIQLIPMNSYVPALEKLASEHLGEPVSIGAMRFSILSGVTINLQNVRLGTTQDVKIERVTITPELGSVFGEVKVIRKLEVDNVTVAEEVLSRLPKWLASAVADKKVEVGRVQIRNVKLESRVVKLPSFDVDLQLTPEGTIRKATVANSDGKASLELVPHDNQIDLLLTASKGWIPPVGPQIEFSDLTAKGVATNNQISVEKFEALLYNGAAKGSAQITWGGPWSLEGDVQMERIAMQDLMGVFTRDAKSTGALESQLRYSMSSPALATMFDSPKVDGTFVIKKGDLDGVDLVRALQSGGRGVTQGGATRFEEISGSVGLVNDRYQFRNMKLQSGLLSSAGSFDVSPDKDVSGRITVELRWQAAQIRGSFVVNGGLKAIALRPN